MPTSATLNNHFVFLIFYFRYILRKELTTFGSKLADIKLMSLAVVKEHCSVRFDGTNIFIIGGKGDTYHNGKLVPEGTEQKVQYPFFNKSPFSNSLRTLFFCRWRSSTAWLLVTS